MNATKAIFLDIDGVLNSNNTKVFTRHSCSVFVDDFLIERLKKIIDATNAVVIFSSDWRYDRYDERYNQDFLELKDKLVQFGIHFYGFTPEFHDWNSRGKEIEMYLSKHPEIKKFVILDDRDDMEPYMNHLVRTSNRYGLTDEDVEDAIKILEE